MAPRLIVPTSLRLSIPQRVALKQDSLLLPQPKVILRKKMSTDNEISANSSSTALSLLPAPQFRSVQCPLQPLERAGSFVGANCRLAVVAIADTYQDGDVLESILHKCQNLSELNGLSVCEARQTISYAGHCVDETRSEHLPPK